MDALQCKLPSAGGNTYAVCKRVKANAPPNDASPFESAYSRAYDATAMSKRGALVYSPSPDVFCVVTVQDRPVECLLHCSTECAGKMGAACP